MADKLLGEWLYWEIEKIDNIWKILMLLRMMIRYSVAPDKMQ